MLFDSTVLPTEEKGVIAIDLDVAMVNQYVIASIMSGNGKGFTLEELFRCLFKCLFLLFNCSMVYFIVL